VEEKTVSPPTELWNLDLPRSENHSLCVPGERMAKALKLRTHPLFREGAEQGTRGGRVRSPSRMNNYR